MKKYTTRREILKLGLIGLGLAACRGRAAQTPPPSPTEPVQPAWTASPPASASATSIPTLAPSQTASPLPALTPPSPAFIVDGHADIAWNALEFGRDPLQSAFAGREQEAGTRLRELVGLRTTGLPEWVAGRVGLIFATLFVMPAARAYSGYRKLVYTTADEARDRAWEQLEYYRETAETEPLLHLVETQADLQAVEASWTGTDRARPGIVGWIILMEGADPILSPQDLETWHTAGLRLVGPAWATTRYASGAGDPGGLTRLGHELLAAMAELKMGLDLSHLSERACREALEVYPGTVFASHSNPRPFLPSERGLSDAVIRGLAEREGVMGIMPYNRYLVPGWTQQQGKESVTLERVVEAIDYVVQLTGSARHAALGSDFDGGFGAESIPAEMESAADLIKIAGALEARGYGREDIEAILQGNWLRVVRACLR